MRTPLCVKTYVAANGLSCRGSKIADIETKSGKEKKIKNVRERVQKALYFIELFGLKVETLKVKDDKGENYNLKLTFHLGSWQSEVIDIF